MQTVQINAHFDKVIPSEIRLKLLNSVLFKCADPLAGFGSEVDAGGTVVLVTHIGGDSFAVNVSPEAPSVIQNKETFDEPQYPLIHNIFKASDVH